MPPLKIIHLASESSTPTPYENHPIASINDHEVRISIMTQPFHWHSHPDSDECFLALEGGLIIDLDDHTIELLPGHMVTIPRGVRHRTRPIGPRSVNLTFERTNAETLALPPPQ